MPHLFPTCLNPTCTDGAVNLIPKRPQQADNFNNAMTLWGIPTAIVSRDPYICKPWVVKADYHLTIIGIFHWCSWCSLGSTTDDNKTGYFLLILFKKNREGRRSHYRSTILNLHLHSMTVQVPTFAPKHFHVPFLFTCCLELAYFP